MRRNNHAMAFVGLTLSLILLVSGITRGDPGGTGCEPTCANRAYFINAMGCSKWSPAVCTYCVSGQCSGAYVDTEKCQGMGTRNTFLWLYGISQCDTPCATILIDGYTEATEPWGDGEIWPTPFPLTQCP